MKGFIGLTQKAKEDILKQHSKPYDGYAVGNVPSNMYPLTTFNDARDNKGITVDMNGNVKPYTNHRINEITAKPLNYDEIEPAYEFDSQGPETAMVVDPYDESPAYEFKSKGPVDVFEDPEYNELLNSDEDLQQKRDEIEESVYKSLDMFKRFQKFN